MNQIVEYGGSNGFGKRVQTYDAGPQYRTAYDPGMGQGMGEMVRPVSIQINVGRDEGGSKDRKGFSIWKSKIVWLMLSLAVSAGFGYARTRTVCQGFKDTGKFYYGMDVNRCIGILIKEPLASVDAQLGRLNGHY